DSTDLPVNPSYLDSVRLAGNVKILDVSRWLNQVCIETTDSVALVKINSFPFVIMSTPVMKPAGINTFFNNKFNEQLTSANSQAMTNGTSGYYDYGNAAGQINIHHGDYLHNLGFHGEGMLIAMLDAGYYHYLSIPAFDSMRANHQVLETFNFVTNSDSVNEDYFHGMSCLSEIASNLPGVMVGAAPKSDFCLYVSEDVSSESPVEEQYWAAAAERADSLGADVISTSLGYSTFDNPALNHSYSDMNGHTTIAARAAGLAAKKGIIVVVAAGNEGNSPWHYLTTPADADSILSVGAVDQTGTSASFSSYGPSSDGRVKPEVAAVGKGAAIIYTNGSVISGGGTSFATPTIAGLVTCLWQAFPDFTNMDIIRAVERSCPTYLTPDDRRGYGIPDFEVAYKDLAQQRALRNADSLLGTDWIKVYPNPFSGSFQVILKPSYSATGTLRLYDALGRLYESLPVTALQGQPQIVNFENKQPLQKGFYILKYEDDHVHRSFSLIGK
ncbi:MAG: S8 family peptidase, partial [Bacteroidota bacterium]|nr:S8 family peptidase [Bacteroidota bacterium]